MAVHVEQRRYLHPTSQMSIDMQPEPNHCIQRTRRLRFLSMLNVYWRRVADVVRYAN